MCQLLPRCPKAGPGCWVSTGICLCGGAGFPSIFDGKRKMQAAGITVIRSWAVPAAGSPLAACLLGPTGIMQHHLVFPSCFAWVGTAGSPRLPIHLTPRGCLEAPVPHAAFTPCPWAHLGAILPGCLESSRGSCWVWLSSTTTNHFWVFLQPASLSLPSTTSPRACLLLSCRL